MLPALTRLYIDGFNEKVATQAWPKIFEENKHSERKFCYEKAITAFTYIFVRGMRNKLFKYDGYHYCETSGEDFPTNPLRIRNHQRNYDRSGEKSGSIKMQQ
jgi:hypothetical protein